MLSLPLSTTWLAFLLGTTLIGIGICVYYARVRIRRLTIRNTALGQQVEYRTRQAEDALHIKDLFMTNMSHEIRTPMNGLLGMASLLSQTPLNKEQNNYVDNIRSCGDTLLTVINKYSRLHRHRDRENNPRRKK